LTHQPNHTCTNPENFPSPSGGVLTTLPRLFIMRHVFLTLLAAILLALSTGCTFFKGSKKPKESSAISGEVEETFRRRWVEKRASELSAQGVTREAAATQAENEFRQRYNFSRGTAKE
jgi:hypothetical protein